MAKFTDCYNGPGEVLSTERIPGQDMGSSRFGKLVAELPIIRDYVLKTNPGANWALALLAGETDRDWWDKGGLKEPYVDVLIKRHKNISQADLEKDTLQIPDILTYNGLSLWRRTGSGKIEGLVSGRHEYYEIKPDNEGQIKKGQDKLSDIGRTFRNKKYNLPYKRGVAYPHLDRIVAGLPIEIKIPVNSAFIQELQYLIKRGYLTNIRVFMQVRRPEDGLLLYKLCIEIQDDDRKRGKQIIMRKALVKHVYATYLATHFPQDFARMEPELGDFSFEGDKLPRPRCSWNVVDELESLQQKLETIIHVRGLGFPGEHYIVCCEEVMWQYLVRPMTVKDIWEKIKNTVRNLFVSLGQSALWAQVQPLFLEAEDAAGLAQKWLLQRSLIDLEIMANVVLAYIQKNPGTVIAIVLAPLLITAGVAALLEIGMLAALVGGSEAGVGAATAGQVFGGLGRVALAEEILLGTRVGAGVSGVLTPATVGGAGQVILLNAMRGKAMKTAVEVVAAAAGFLLMTVHTQAYAMGTHTPVSSSGTIPSNATLIAEQASGLFIVPAQDSPRLRRPAKGSIVNLRDLATVPDTDEEKKKLFTTNPFQPRPAVWTRYLGTMSIS